MQTEGDTVAALADFDLPGDVEARPRSGLFSFVAKSLRSASVAQPHDLLWHYARLVVGADLAAAALAAVVGLTLRFGSHPATTYVALTALAPVFWLAAVGVKGGYERRFLGTGPEEYRRLADATLLLFVVLAAASFASKSDISRAYVMISLPAAFLFSYVGRRQLRSWLYRRRLAGEGLQRVLVVGRADSVAHLSTQFAREPWLGLVPVGTKVLEPADLAGDSANRPSDGLEAVLASVDACDAKVLAVASHPDLSGEALRRLAWELEGRRVDLLVSPGILEVTGARLSIRPVAGLSLLHLERPAFRGWRVLAKALVDRGASLALIAMVSPLLMVTALAVKVGSRGPVLFHQTRIGVDGEPFRMLKFRSMVVDAECRLPELQVNNEHDGLMFKMRDDPRITRVGKVMRRFSLDELPQLWNVVRGEMSLVGPRPPLPQEVERYDHAALRRLRVRPGLTGLWQVSGRSNLSWDESLRLDLRYVDNWSLWLDLTILWRTGRAVLARNGAY